MTATRVRAPEVADSRPSDTTVVERLPKPAVAGRFPVAERADDDDDQDALEPVADPIEPIETAPPVETPAPRYTLSFSSGEVVEVTGSGLIGRRPITQPGEQVDQLVAVLDPGRSVSKTHVEFGLEGGELWICDRYSGNGTVAHPLGGVARQCEPGRRYRVTAGTRVEIGDQWFDVS
ncbi:FHA domain-containing protein [Leifsonia sp. NPDC058292]|uniref:FHA domain-containing protein n=1 Tax=Leifsonia sp. NPDC058292 TaxID=3346428 RepID=UPI0036DF299B